MTSNRPYLIRAIYEWVVDNDLTPMLVVRNGGTELGTALEDDQLTVYNISPRAVRDLVIDEESIRFHARFQGVSKHMVLDVEKVARIFCKENNEGLIFPWDDGESSSPSDKDPTPPKGPPHLKVVK
ncbi:MAG: ClpXP protease specificity-enhancing factor SspB [Gammaproteobacteria bacterium]|nr:ClpXP protease specificity-enhancing factor SspB [Gammaproteobacteria bacterium]MDE0301762.1 ClpXP protease specificity-enhancing factor SspB [Gammaproteobacteria bacterium]